MLMFTENAPRKSQARLLFVVNDAAFFVSHRLPIAAHAIKNGYEVHVATPNGAKIDEIISAGCSHHELPLTRSGRNIFLEVRSIYSIWRLFRRLRPDVIHLVTIKPILYGGIAARFAKIRGVVIAIAGLGHVFDELGKRRVLNECLRLIYRFVVSSGNVRIIFQNPSDQKELVDFTGVAQEKTILIPGSGVDLAVYAVKREPSYPPIVVIFASRLLRTKGVSEFAQAARILRERGVSVRFLLAGEIDFDNPEAISEEDLRSWQREGYVEVLGRRDDIPALFAESHIVTLPSYYREGVPKVLIEAASCGRPVITTDHPGCRDAIEVGKTGLLVCPRDALALADAIQVVAQDESLRRQMGSAGRRLAEEKFSIEGVVATHLELYRELLDHQAEAEVQTLA